MTVTLRFLDSYDLEAYSPPTPNMGPGPLRAGSEGGYGGAYDPEYGELVPPFGDLPFSGAYGLDAFSQESEDAALGRNPFLDDRWRPIATVFQLTVANERDDKIVVDAEGAALINAQGGREPSLGARSAYWEAHNPALLATVPAPVYGPEALAGTGEQGGGETVAGDYLFGTKAVYPGVAKQGLLAFPLVEPEAARGGLRVELRGVTLFDGDQAMEALTFDLAYPDLPAEAFERGRSDRPRQAVPRQRGPVWRSKKVYAAYALAGAWLVVSGFFTSLFDVRD